MSEQSKRKLFSKQNTDSSLRSLKLSFSEVIRQRALVCVTCYFLWNYGALLNAGTWSTHALEGSLGGNLEEIGPKSIAWFPLKPNVEWTKRSPLKLPDFRAKSSFRCGWFISGKLTVIVVINTMEWTRWRLCVRWRLKQSPKAAIHELLTVDVAISFVKLLFIAWANALTASRHYLENGIYLREIRWTRSHPSDDASENEQENTKFSTHFPMKNKQSLQFMSLHAVDERFVEANSSTMCSGEYMRDTESLTLHSECLLAFF